MKLLHTYEIKIGETILKVKPSIRAMLKFEEMTGKSVEDLDTLKDTIIFFYCTLTGTNLTYDEFIDLMDDYPESLASFSDALLTKGEKKVEPV